MKRSPFKRDSIEECGKDSRVSEKELGIRDTKTNYFYTLKNVFRNGMKKEFISLIVILIQEFKKILAKFSVLSGYLEQL